MGVLSDLAFSYRGSLQTPPYCLVLVSRYIAGDTCTYRGVYCLPALQDTGTTCHFFQNWTGAMHVEVVLGFGTCRHCQLA
jgi:hypothetical protein